MWSCRQRGPHCRLLSVTARWGRVAPFRVVLMFSWLPARPAAACGLLSVGVAAFTVGRGKKMTVTSKMINTIVISGVVLMAPASLRGQGTAEVFTATAAVKTAAGAAASAPVTISIDRKMSKSEADAIVAAFKSGGAPALRKALVGVKPTGTVQIGTGKATPTRITIERATGSGRLVTIVTDQPLLFLGAGVPGAKPQAG